MNPASSTGETGLLDAVREIGCDVGLKSSLRFIRTHILSAINVHEKELQYLGQELLLSKLVPYFNREVLHIKADHPDAV